jgi:sialate O-acetylesterase
MRVSFIGLFLALIFFSAVPAKANVKVNALFGENAVLQRRKPIAVWGTAEPDEVVVVKLQNTCTNTTADKSGKWMVHLPAFEAGGPYALTVKGKNRLVFHNVYVGEVWLCSGQSNMEIPVSYSKHTKEDIDNSTNPDLHLFWIKDSLSTTPLTDYESSWQTANPKTIQDFSAVAYFFGRALQKEAHMPIGIICAAHYGTPIKVWMSPDAIQASHDLAQVDPPANFLAIRNDFDKKMSEWRIAVAAAREKGLEEPAKPVLPSDFYANSSAFNGMINPMVPYTLRGVCWYQGESDYQIPEKWRANFAYFIDDWRKRWHDPIMPFLYVQVPAFGKKTDKPGESHWAQLRESQLFARRIPYAYMVCAIDTATGDDIDAHPREKKEIGERLEQVALGCVYKRPVPFSGPLYDSMSIEGNKIKLSFRFAENGLKAKGGKSLEGFTIAGVDKKFVPAEARIVGDYVVVSSKEVTAPVAVRYGWAPNPDGNLFNSADLPASPFRTDRWIAHFSKKQDT